MTTKSLFMAKLTIQNMRALGLRARIIRSYPSGFENDVLYTVVSLRGNNVNG